MQLYTFHVCGVAAMHAFSAAWLLEADSFWPVNCVKLLLQLVLIPVAAEQPGQHNTSKLHWRLLADILCCELCCIGPC